MGVSVPIEPSGSVLLSAVGAMMTLSSSWV